MFSVFSPARGDRSLLSPLRGFYNVLVSAFPGLKSWAIIISPYRGMPQSKTSNISLSYIQSEPKTAKLELRHTRFNVQRSTFNVRRSLYPLPRQRKPKLRYEPERQIRSLLFPSAFPAISPVTASTVLRNRTYRSSTLLVVLRGNTGRFVVCWEIG